MHVSTQKIKISTNHISDQRPCLLGYSKQSHRKTRLLVGQESILLAGFAILGTTGTPRNQWTWQLLG